jgi:hypothetical protein
MPNRKTSHERRKKTRSHAAGKTRRSNQKDEAAMLAAIRKWFTES